ncbi:hypothetical protein BU14_0177s0030 [Porphyra umbilicalis]|uniref:Uncharacterized protein n=1 Tax=Porphyra umbilicalis TaxID=2786 RepID=A0A1X6P782_PORUM|nr:hypothetical protein BU14_0177s0030 [Porphyra umbilicalis]|eukprot:OSX76752.1 hypothetical protein BU14_0177s0030 [Porphyra umbilicalis]
MRQGAVRPAWQPRRRPWAPTHRRVAPWQTKQREAAPSHTLGWLRRPLPRPAPCLPQCPPPPPTHSLLHYGRRAIPPPGDGGGDPDGLGSPSWAHYASRHARAWRGKCLVVNPAGGALLHATTYRLKPDGEAVERTSRNGGVAIHLTHTYTFPAAPGAAAAAAAVTETQETVFASRTFHVFADGAYTTETPMLVAPALLGTDTPFPSAVEHVLPLSATERVRGLALYDDEGRCRRVALLEEVTDGADWEARPPLALSSLVGLWSGSAVTKRFRGAGGGVVGAGVGMGGVPGKATWEETIAATVVGAEFPTTTRSTFGWDGGDRVRRCTVVKPAAPPPGGGGGGGKVTEWDTGGGTDVAAAASAAVAAATAAAASGGTPAAADGGGSGGGGGATGRGRGRRRDGGDPATAGETLTAYGTVDGGGGGAPTRRWRVAAVATAGAAPCTRRGCSLGRACRRSG